jgi:hypothetical protein
MMLNPLSMEKLGQIRHQEMLEEAEAARQRKQNRSSRAVPGIHPLAYVGSVLVAAGQKLGAEDHSEVKVSA